MSLCRFMNIFSYLLHHAECHCLKRLIPRVACHCLSLCECVLVPSHATLCYIPWQTHTTPKETFLIFLVTGSAADTVIILDPARGKKVRTEQSEINCMVSVITLNELPMRIMGLIHCTVIICVIF